MSNNLVFRRGEGGVSGMRWSAFVPQNACDTNIHTAKYNVSH